MFKETSKNLSVKKEYIAIAFMVLLFLGMSIVSLMSIDQLQGNARVINYTGIVRGATQRLIKKEMQGNPDELLIKRLDSIIRELRFGDGSHKSIALRDKAFQNDMTQVSEEWERMKSEIKRVRAGQGVWELYHMSEQYFELVDRAASSAETYAEKQIATSKKLLIGALVLFVIFMAGASVNYLRTLGLKRRADLLGRLAYIDTLTQMPNRASCERKIQEYIQNPPKGSLAAVMFDMNNLKKANDIRGRQEGDQIIVSFANILKSESQPFGFVARYGGDEFLALFKNIDERGVEDFLARVSAKVVAHNLFYLDDIDKISFAAGYHISGKGDNDLYGLINLADRDMYERKRQMKENREL